MLTGDPASIGVACSIVSDITNGKYNVLKWDKQERKYYPIEINLYEKGEIDRLNNENSNTINFEAGSTRCNEKTDNIQSLADQVEKTRGIALKNRKQVRKSKRFKKRISTYIR